MSVFVDTSGLLAMLDADDENHERADRIWCGLIDAEEPLLTTNYVLVETHALVRVRLGMQAVKVLAEAVVPVFVVHWIAEQEHAKAVEALLTASRRRLSLVDCTSFVVMRLRGMDKALAFDRDFREQGFTCLH